MFSGFFSLVEFLHIQESTIIVVLREGQITVMTCRAGQDHRALSRKLIGMEEDSGNPRCQN